MGRQPHGQRARCGRRRRHHRAGRHGRVASVVAARECLAFAGEGRGEGRARQGHHPSNRPRAHQRGPLLLQPGPRSRPEPQGSRRGAVHDRPTGNVPVAVVGRPRVGTTRSASASRRRSSAGSSRSPKAAATWSSPTRSCSSPTISSRRAVGASRGATRRSVSAAAQARAHTDPGARRACRIRSGQFANVMTALAEGRTATRSRRRSRGARPMPASDGAARTRRGRRSARQSRDGSPRLRIDHRSPSRPRGPAPIRRCIALTARRRRARARARHVHEGALVPAGSPIELPRRRIRIARGRSPSRCIHRVGRGIERRADRVARFRRRAKGAARGPRDRRRRWVASDLGALPKIDWTFRQHGIELAKEPSTRFVLTWETNANDADFHIHDAQGDHAFYGNKRLASGGELFADVTTGYAPECFAIPGSRSPGLTCSPRSTSHAVRWASAWATSRCSCTTAQGVCSSKCARS